MANTWVSTTNLPDGSHKACKVVDIPSLLLVKNTSLWTECPRVSGLVCVCGFSGVENGRNGTLLEDILYPVVTPCEFIWADQCS